MYVIFSVNLKFLFKNFINIIIVNIIENICIINEYWKERLNFNWCFILGLRVREEGGGYLLVKIMINLRLEIYFIDR